MSLVRRFFSPVLDPVDRLSEVIFGLIMALSFTLTFSVATAGREDVRELLIGVLGCNIAWGIVDGVMYVIAQVVSRTRALANLRAVRTAVDAAAAAQLIADAMPESLAAALLPEELARMRTRLLNAPEPPRYASVTARDLRGALACFLLVFLSTLPVALPFAVMGEPILALRISNVIAIVMLYFSGHSLAKWAGFRPVRSGLALVLIGLVLTAITIALGG